MTRWNRGKGWPRNEVKERWKAGRKTRQREVKKVQGEDCWEGKQEATLWMQGELAKRLSRGEGRGNAQRDGEVNRGFDSMSARRRCCTRLRYRSAELLVMWV